MIPLNVAVPDPAKMVKFCVPLIVLFTVLKEMLLLFVVIVLGPVMKLTGYGIVRGLAPETVILAPI